ncbi:hypothetical protein DFH09DRAFT_1316717 [Mycena vulgaris]|nr:hypothetical protein DFH09DRAFT_1316717 [Mycena vulgaris]
MDIPPSSPFEFNSDSDSTHEDPGYSSDSARVDPGYTSSGGAIFSACQKLTVSGGTFTSITKSYNTTHHTAAPTVSDFRVVLLGDIDLQDELLLEYDTGIEWLEDINRYASLRHPNFVQLCGVTTSPRMHAAIFHDDMMPFEDFVDLYRHSPILTAYIYGYCNTQFRAVKGYFSSTFQQVLLEIECSFWIRRSTGRLCADLIPSNIYHWYSGAGGIVAGASLGITSLDALSHEEAAIDALTLQEYHSISYWHMSHTRSISLSTSITMTLAAIIYLDSSDQLEDAVEIAVLPQIEVNNHGWNICGVVGEVMQDGWTRYESSDVSDCIIELLCTYPRTSEAWLSQANYVFSRLGITSNFEDYSIVDNIYFDITISPTTEEDPPAGFLFLCPADDVQTGPASFRLPDCPAFWSLNSAGIQRLSTEEATQLGFSSIQSTIRTWVESWNPSVYDGLRQFHKAKGFDPESQDVARHLEEPLYQLSDPLFAHVEACSEDDELRFAGLESVMSQALEFGRKYGLEPLIILLASYWFHHHIREELE